MKNASDSHDESAAVSTFRIFAAFVRGEEYGAYLYGIADYAVNQASETLTDKQTAFLIENVLNKA